jgi:hypothetical protein
MQMKFYAIVRDDWIECPGETTFGPYDTRKEAQFAAEREVNACAELFPDGRTNLSWKIKQR